MTRLRDNFKSIKDKKYTLDFSAAGNQGTIECDICSTLDKEIEAQFSSVASILPWPSGHRLKNVSAPIFSLSQAFTINVVEAPFGRSLIHRTQLSSSVMANLITASRRRARERGRKKSKKIHSSGAVMMTIASGISSLLSILFLRDQINDRKRSEDT